MQDDLKQKWFDAIVWTVALLFTALLAREAYAGERYAVDNASYRDECGSCHIAYPPALLGVDGWRDVMRGLDRHFGTDASVGEPARSEIGDYLAGAAGTRGKRATATTLRISETRWFRKEHDEVPGATWKNPAVKSAAHCDACHLQAERGDFSERNIRLPRQEWR